MLNALQTKAPRVLPNPTTIKNMPLYVKIEDPNIDHEEALTRVAVHVLSRHDSSKVINSLQTYYDFAYTMCGKMYTSGLLLSKIDELRRS